MPLLKFEHEPIKGSIDAVTTNTSILDQSEDAEVVRQKRWKLRLKRRVETEDKDTKKKNKKVKSRKQDTPVVLEDIEEWELGPTMDEMRQGVLDKYYEDVRSRANCLVENRDQVGIRKVIQPPTAEYIRNLLDRDYDEISSISTLLTESDVKLPTILEASRENFSDGQVPPKSATTLHSLLTSLTTSNEIFDESKTRKSLVDMKTPDLTSISRKSILSQDFTGCSPSPTKTLHSQQVDEAFQPDLHTDAGENIAGQIETTQMIEAMNTQGVDKTSYADVQMNNVKAYDDNQFGQRISKETVLNYVQNKLNRYLPRKDDSMLKEKVPEDEAYNVEGQEQEDDLNTEVVTQELSADEIKAIFECVWVGDVDLLDDMLDLPGAYINIRWFGENMLMTAIRAGNAEVAAYLIENNIDTKAEVARFERQEDVKIEIEMRKALETANEKPTKKKSKKKMKEKNREKETSDDQSNDHSTIRDSTFRDDAVKSPEMRNNSHLTDMECHMVDCREMAQEFAMFDIVNIIDKSHGQLWDDSKHIKTASRPRKPLEDKLREQGLYFEDDDNNFMLEPEKCKPNEPEERNHGSRQSKKGHHSAMDEAFDNTLPQPAAVHEEEQTKPDGNVAEMNIVSVAHPKTEVREGLADGEKTKPTKKYQVKGTKSYLLKQVFSNRENSMCHNFENHSEKIRASAVYQISRAKGNHHISLSNSKEYSKPKYNFISRSLESFGNPQHSGIKCGFDNSYASLSKVRQVKPWEEDKPEYFDTLVKRQNHGTHVRSQTSIKKAMPLMKRENTVLPVVRNVNGNLKSATYPVKGAFRIPSAEHNDFQKDQPKRKSIPLPSNSGNERQKQGGLWDQLLRTQSQPLPKNNTSLLQNKRPYINANVDFNDHMKHTARPNNAKTPLQNSNRLYTGNRQSDAVPMTYPRVTKGYQELPKVSYEGSAVSRNCAVVDFHTSSHSFRNKPQRKMTRFAIHL